MMRCLMCNESIEVIPRLRYLLTFTESKEYCCTECKSHFKKLLKVRCPNCYKEMHGNECVDCQIWKKKGYTPNHIAIFRYEGFMKEYFSHYKFMGDYYLRKIFQEDIVDALNPLLKKGYTLVPVPLSEERFAERGFNQVEGLLEELPYQNIFGKKDIEKQSSKTRKERLNQENPFFIKQNVELSRKIVIVDDIYTTGSTIYKMVQLLQKTHVEEIVTFSLAR